MAFKILHKIKAMSDAQIRFRIEEDYIRHRHPENIWLVSNIIYNECQASKYIGGYYPIPIDYKEAEAHLEPRVLKMRDKVIKQYKLQQLLKKN